MLDFQEQKPKVRIDFKDADTGIHINIQETESRRDSEGATSVSYWISAHYHKDRYYNSLEFNTNTLEEAKAVATKVFEFMKEVRPQLRVLFKKDDSGCGCDE